MAGTTARSTQPPLRLCGVTRDVTTGWGHGQGLAGSRGGAGKVLLPPSVCSSLGAGGKSFPWEPSLCCLCGFAPLGKEMTVCSISLAWISRKKAMAVGGIADRGALPALGGDDKMPHSSPCCPLSVGMLLHCDISQSLLASCGSGLIVLLPQAAPLCPLLRQLFAPAAHPSNLELSKGHLLFCSRGGSSHHAADLFYPLDLGTVFAERLGAWGHCWGHHWGHCCSPLH